MHIYKTNKINNWIKNTTKKNVFYLPKNVMHTKQTKQRNIHTHAHYIQSLNLYKHARHNHSLHTHNKHVLNTALYTEQHWSALYTSDCMQRTDVAQSGRRLCCTSQHECPTLAHTWHTVNVHTVGLYKSARLVWAFIPFVTFRAQTSELMKSSA